MTLEELNVFVTTQANVGMEAYYWWCTGLMIIIHVGFLMYEVGATRMKNAVSSGCLLYTSPSPRDGLLSRMPSSA